MLEKRNTIILNIAQRDLLDEDFFKSISIELSGYCYRLTTTEKSGEREMHYRPRSDNYLFYNSFLPEIIVAEKCNAHNFELNISSKFTLTTRIGISILLFFLLCVQLTLIFLAFNGKRIAYVAWCLPSIFAVFLGVLASVTKKYITRMFTKRMIEEISGKTSDTGEQLIL